MKFYKQQHKYYCGIDLHARKMYVCILDQKGSTMMKGSRGWAAVLVGG